MTYVNILWIAVCLEELLFITFESEGSKRKYPGGLMF